MSLNRRASGTLRYTSCGTGIVCVITAAAAARSAGRGRRASSLIAGSRIVTADVLALTTSADTHAAVSTPVPALRATGGSAAAAAALDTPREWNIYARERCSPPLGETKPPRPRG